MSRKEDCSKISGTGRLWRVASAGLLWLGGHPAARAEVPLWPPSATLYVANQGQADGTGSSVSVIDGRTLQVTATIRFGKAGPVYPIVSPDGKYLWVTQELDDFNTGGCDSSAVSVVRLSTLKIETTLPLPQCPNTLVFSADGKFAYTMSSAGPVSVIETATRKVVTSIAVSTGQYDIALSKDGRWLYAADVGDANLTVIDTRINKPVRQIALGGAPFAIVLTPDGKRAFVTPASLTGGVTEIDLRTEHVVATIPPTVGSTTNGVAITPDGKLLLDVDYSAQTVWLYSTYGQSQIGSIAPVNYPDGIALSPLGDLAYVTDDNCPAFPCTNKGFVTVLSTRTRAVLGTINVGINPQFITAFPQPDTGIWHGPVRPE